MYKNIECILFKIVFCYIRGGILLGGDFIKKNRK